MTELNFWPEIFTYNVQAGFGGQYLVDNGHGCSQQIFISAQKGQYNLQYISYKSKNHLDWHLASTECELGYSESISWACR
jgi:hypothetical protein